jgi:hypothetical protein
MDAYEIFCYLLGWLLAIVLRGFGWLVIVSNFRCVYAWLARREHHSQIPLVGGFFALVGMIFCPVPQVRMLAWIPLVVDVGFFIVVTTIGLLMLLYEWRVKKKKRDLPGCDDGVA